MAVLSLLLGGEENTVRLAAPLLLREMNGGRGCGMKHGTVSLLPLLLTFAPLTGLPSLNRWTDLACKLTQQAKDDGSWVVKVHWTYGGIKNKKQKTSMSEYEMSIETH